MAGPSNIRMSPAGMAGHSEDVTFTSTNDGWFDPQLSLIFYTSYGYYFTGITKATIVPT
jgi:hypothetical protein